MFYAHLGQFYSVPRLPGAQLLRAPSPALFTATRLRTGRGLLPQQYAAWKFSIAAPGIPLTPVCGSTLTLDQARAIAKQIVDVITKPFGAPMPPNCNREWLTSFRQNWLNSPTGSQLSVYGYRNEQLSLTEGPVTKTTFSP